MTTSISSEAQKISINLPNKYVILKIFFNNRKFKNPRRLENHISLYDQILIKSFFDDQSFITMENISYDVIQKGKKVTETVYTSF